MVILRCHILNYIATTQQYCWHVPTDQGLWATDPVMLKKIFYTSLTVRWG